MKRIEKLTPEQAAMMPIVRDKWIEIGLRTGETDWKTFEENIPLAYDKAGIKFPNKIIRVQSPMVGAIAASIANSLLKGRAVGGAVDGAVDGAVGDAVGGAVGSAVGGAVRDAVGGAVVGAVRDAVMGAVRGAVGSAVMGAVGSAVDGAVGSAVDDAVGSAVDDAVGSAVDDAVGSAVHGAVRDAVMGAVRGAVGSAVHDAVGSAVGSAVGGIKLKWHYWLGGQFWVGSWYYGTSYVSFFIEHCGLELPHDIIERFNINKKINESANYYWPNSEFVMVCARPKVINRNAEGRLHCINGKSIEYPDGWGLYHLNGASFNEELYWKVVSGSMPFEEILAIEDIDQRTQAMRFGDAYKFLNTVNGKRIDLHVKNSSKGEIKYELYSVPKGDIFTQKSFFMVYNCPSTGKIYMSGVEPFKTVADAMAWKQGTTSENWLSMVPLIHES